MRELGGLSRAGGKWGRESVLKSVCWQRGQGVSAGGRMGGKEGGRTEDGKRGAGCACVRVERKGRCNFRQGGAISLTMRACVRACVCVCVCMCVSPACLV